MATFQSGNKAAKKRRVGPGIVKLKGKKGLYLRWYETREKYQDQTITADMPHGLSLQPAPQGGVTVTRKPGAKNPFCKLLEKDDAILKIAGKNINSQDDLERVLEEYKGKQVLMRINKGGKAGTIPRFAKAGNNREEAKAFLADWGTIKKKREKAKDKTEVTFSQLVDEFLKWAETPSAGYSKTWLKDVKRIIEGHRTRWGALPLNKITPELIRRWYNERASKVAASTLVNEISPLRRAFKLAIREYKYIKEDPSKDITFRQPAARTPHYLSEEEIEQLMAIARTRDANRLNPEMTFKGGVTYNILGQTADELRTNRYNSDGTFDTARIRFLMLTALRKSQFIDLKWTNYDAKRGTLTLQTTDEHSEKTRKVHVIPLPEAAKTIITGQPRNSTYIFPNLEGNHDAEIAKRIRKVFKAFEKEHAKHVHLHMLRHTGLTQLLKHSQNIAAVSKYAGHSNIKTTEIYAHVLDQQLQEITSDFDIGGNGDAEESGD